MTTETIRLGRRRIATLAELLRPGLKAVIVGLNPSPVSVAAGHYYQGRLGKLLWKRLQSGEILTGLPAGAEDEAAFAQGFGFADLVRRPTTRATGLTRHERAAGAADLVERLEAVVTGGERPLILFVFAAAAAAAGPALEAKGYQTVRMPGPYAARPEVDKALRRLKSKIGAL